MEDLEGHNQAEVRVGAAERERGCGCRELCLDHDSGWVADIVVFEWILLSDLPRMGLIPGTVGRNNQDPLKLPLDRGWHIHAYH